MKTQLLTSKKDDKMLTLCKRRRSDRYYKSGSCTITSLAVIIEWIVSKSQTIYWQARPSRLFVCSPVMPIKCTSIQTNCVVRLVYNLIDVIIIIITISTLSCRLSFSLFFSSFHQWMLCRVLNVASFGTNDSTPWKDIMKERASEFNNTDNYQLPILLRWIKKSNDKMHRSIDTNEKKKKRKNSSKTHTKGQDLEDFKHNLTRGDTCVKDINHWELFNAHGDMSGHGLELKDTKITRWMNYVKGERWEVVLLIDEDIESDNNISIDITETINHNDGNVSFTWLQETIIYICFSLLNLIVWLGKRKNSSTN